MSTFHYDPTPILRKWPPQGPQIENAMMSLVRRREWLCRNFPSCPKCTSRDQIQLVDWISRGPAQWRCRLCNHHFNHEPQ